MIVKIIPGKTITPIDRKNIQESIVVVVPDRNAHVRKRRCDSSFHS